MPNIYLRHFRDLLNALKGEMRKAGEVLDIEVDEALSPDCALLESRR